MSRIFGDHHGTSYVSLRKNGSLGIPAILMLIVMMKNGLNQGSLHSASLFKAKV